MSVVEESQSKDRPAPELRLLDGTQPEAPELIDSEPAEAADSVASDRLPEAFKKVLTVGGGIRVRGEISACDTLIVEGDVDVTLANSRHLDILKGGVCCGRAEVDSAVISGLFEGDLTVRHSLRITKSGQVKGTIRYGSLEIDTGGELNGDVSVRASNI